MKNNSNSHTIQTAMALIMFCLFLVSILLVLTSGVKSYSSIASKLSSRYESRTCLNYISSKVKYNDTQNSVDIKDFNGKNALYIKNQIDDKEFNTIIYYYDGYVKELTVEEGKELGLNSGQNIVPIKNIEFKKVKNNLIHIYCTDNKGDKKDAYISLKSEDGGTSNGK
ncbi:DUF4860 domain-containing protein [uncultured Anaerofustis sp.]|uniref:DUF4860 domain-containing protein n=1 Tax=uncultured Anaerofustis sp. TaxID=904996 RepID=UPI0025D829F6|nr:DUF4860 domain-containing protein [uncultured Anaerofustis sp.]